MLSENFTSSLFCGCVMRFPSWVVPNLSVSLWKTAAQNERVNYGAETRSFTLTDSVSRSPWPFLLAGGKNQQTCWTRFCILTERCPRTFDDARPKVYFYEKLCIHEPLLRSVTDERSSEIARNLEVTNHGCSKCHIIGFARRMQPWLNNTESNDGHYFVCANDSCHFSQFLSPRRRVVI